MNFPTAQIQHSVASNLLNTYLWLETLNPKPGTKDPGGWGRKKQVWPTHWPRVPVAVQLFHPHSRDAGDQKSSAHALHTAWCTVRGCTHAVEPVHTSLLHGFPLTANAWPQSALAYCKQPHWPGHMWGGLVWRRMERLQKNKLAILKTVILWGLLSNLSFLS